MRLKESAKTARMTLTLGALQELYAAKNPCVLSDLFVVERGASAADRTEAENRRWQADVMGALVERRIAAIDDDLFVMGENKEELAAIIANADEDRQLLSDLVFPNARRSSDAEDVLAGAAEVLGQAASVGERDRIALEVIPVIQELIDRTGQDHVAFIGAVTKLGSAVGDVAELIETTNEQARQNTRTVTNRVDKLEDRVIAEQRVTEAMQATLKQVAAALIEITASARTMVQVSAQVQTAANSIIKVSAQLEREDADKVGKLVRAMHQHIEEGKILYDTLLDLTAERTPS